MAALTKLNGIWPEKKFLPFQQPFGGVGGGGGVESLEKIWNFSGFLDLVRSLKKTFILRQGLFMHRMNTSP